MSPLIVHYVVSAGSVEKRVFFLKPGSGKCMKNQVLGVKRNQRPHANDRPEGEPGEGGS